MRKFTSRRIAGAPILSDLPHLGRGSERKEAVMFKRVVALRCAVVLSCVLAGAAAAQPAPLELYSIHSNADGSAQFIVLRIVDGEVPLTGQTLLANNYVGGLRSYTFPSEAPDRQAGRFILVGSEGFADLNLVRPDFIMPNGFLYLPGGRIKIGGDRAFISYVASFCEPGDEFGPCDDFHVAINNAGQSAILAAETRRSFGGLWWNAPAGSEPGWAIAVEHQGHVVVAAWVTYDVDGTATWFVMPRGEIAVNVSGVPDPYTYAGRI
jgi:hypothetical protein